MGGGGGVQTNSGATIRNPITGNQIMFWILSYVNDNTIVKQFKHNITMDEILIGQDGWLDSGV